MQNDAYNYPDTTIATNPYSGEFSIELIPEQFVLNDIITKANYSLFSEDIPVLDLRNSLTPIEVQDTTFLVNIGPNGDTTSIVIDEINVFTYHHKANYIFLKTLVFQ